MPRLSLLVTSLCLCTAAPAVAAVNLQTLIDRSPFAPPPDQAASEGPTEQGVLEFRGMVEEGGQRAYSVFDATANKARWLMVGEGDTFKVKSFDPSTNQLEIEQQGKSVKLALKRSTIQAGAAVVSAPPPNGQPNVNAANQANDARRLETVAAEVRRRRALRTNAVATPVPPPSPAAAVPAP
jgi:hypothetical protein